jgi:type IV pilus assembly protein PilV
MRTPFSIHALSGRFQAGSFLIEGLFAIMIFSMGILGLIGLQLAAVKQSTDATYRSEASLFASELIGSMWVSDRTPATLKANFEAGGTGFNAWKTKVAGALPGITASANQPTVAVDAATSMVTVTVRWQAPGETDPHSHVIIAQIR